MFHIIKSSRDFGCCVWENVSFSVKNAEIFFVASNSGKGLTLLHMKGMSELKRTYEIKLLLWEDHFLPTVKMLPENGWKHWKQKNDQSFEYYIYVDSNRVIKHFKLILI